MKAVIAMLVGVLISFSAGADTDTAAKRNVIAPISISFLSGFDVSNELGRIKPAPVAAACSGDNPCNCRAGSSGYCTTAKECAEVGGSCS
jgi:hypothetical protein